MAFEPWSIWAKKLMFLSGHREPADIKYFSDLLWFIPIVGPSSSVSHLCGFPSLCKDLLELVFQWRLD